MTNLIGQSLGRYHILEHVSTSLNTSLGEAGWRTVANGCETDKRMVRVVSAYPLGIR